MIRIIIINYIKYAYNKCTDEKKKSNKHDNILSSKLMIQSLVPKFRYVEKRFEKTTFTAIFITQLKVKTIFETRVKQHSKDKTFRDILKRAFRSQLFFPFSN